MDGREGNLMKKYIYTVFLPPIVANIVLSIGNTDTAVWIQQTLENLTIFKLLGIFLNLILNWITAYILNYHIKMIKDVHKESLGVMFLVALSCTTLLPKLINIGETIISKVLLTETKASNNYADSSVYDVKTYNEITNNTPYDQFTSAFFFKSNPTLTDDCLVSAMFKTEEEAFQSAENINLFFKKENLGISPTVTLCNKTGKYFVLIHKIGETKLTYKLIKEKIKKSLNLELTQMPIEKIKDGM